LHARVETAAMLFTLGGLLSASGAFGALSGALSGILTFGVAWRSVGILFRSATLPRGAVPLNLKPSRGTAAEMTVPALEAKNLFFRYRAGGEPVLRDASLVIKDNDRILLEGASGGGKSTFAALLTGLQRPESGLVLLGGLDRETLGATAWRRRVASVPQFHENHILVGTLAFNVLFGRSWPPSPAELELAREVLVALGLGPLLKRMPSGLDQMLGETGWQLSHGEKSRVFLARALVQEPEVLILDETFGSLDPITLKACVEVVVQRSRALLVIAHP